MLPKSAYQTIVACELYYSDMPKSDKLEILEFIEYATEEQILHYLIHGEFVNENETRLLEIGFFLTSVLISVATAAGQAIYTKYNSSAAAACKNKGGIAKEACLKDFKVRGMTGKIAALRKEMGKCWKTEDPDKCQDMFMKHIQKIEEQIRGVKTKSIKK